KHVLRQRLNTRQAHQAVGLLDRKALFPRFAMPLRARRNDVTPDLLIRESDALDACEHAQRNATIDKAGDVGVRRYVLAEHKASTELLVDAFDKRMLGRHGGLFTTLLAMCPQYRRQIAAAQDYRKTARNSASRAAPRWPPMTFSRCDLQGAPPGGTDTGL